MGPRLRGDDSTARSLCVCAVAQRRYTRPAFASCRGRLHRKTCAAHSSDTPWGVSRRRGAESAIVFSRRDSVLLSLRITLCGSVR